jgi:hypothetical protein
VANELLKCECSGIDEPHRASDDKATKRNVSVLEREEDMGCVPFATGS